MEGSDAPQLTSADIARAAGAIVGRPALWWTALRQVFVLAPRGWWRGWPPVPAPDADYVRFRLVTQYGSSGARPTASDVVQYLQWCRALRRGL